MELVHPLRFVYIVIDAVKIMSVGMGRNDFFILYEMIYYTVLVILVTLRLHVLKQSALGNIQNAHSKCKKIVFSKLFEAICYIFVIFRIFII